MSSLGENKASKIKRGPSGPIRPNSILDKAMNQSKFKRSSSDTNEDNLNKVMTVAKTPKENLRITKKNSNKNSSTGYSGTSVQYLSSNKTMTYLSEAEKNSQKNLIRTRGSFDEPTSIRKKDSNESLKHKNQMNNKQNKVNTDVIVFKRTTVDGQVMSSKENRSPLKKQVSASPYQNKTKFEIKAISMKKKGDFSLQESESNRDKLDTKDSKDLDSGRVLVVKDSEGNLITDSPSRKESDLRILSDLKKKKSLQSKKGMQLGIATIEGEKDESSEEELENISNYSLII